MSDLNRLLGSITLTQLLEMLREMGILVSSPYEQMVSEEQAGAPASSGPAGPELEDTSASPSPVPPAPASAPAPAPAPTPAPASLPAVPSSSAQAISTPPPTATPPRPNEAVFAGLLLALSQLGINPNGDPTPSASSASASSSGSSTRVGGSAPDLGGAGDLDVAIAAPAPAAPTEDAGKGKGKEVPRPPEGETLSGFVCASCKTHNVIRPAKDTWYVVTAGREVGVFRGWHNVQPLVSGVSGACYKKYSSEDGARIAFAEALAAGHVVQLS